ncbi:MAG: type III PLP-dependent enzyme [Waterburya sp.]
MERVKRLIDKHFATVAGELYIGGIAVSELVAKYGTPLYVYDSSVLEKQWSLLRNTLPARFAISYSIKANPNSAILKFFIAKGCGLEIASAGEFQRAIQAGCPPEKIIFAGPGKKITDLKLVLQQQIGEIHVESQLEIERISQIAQDLGRPAQIAIRVNPSSEAQGGAMRMGGKPAPFGIDEEVLDTVIERIVSDQNLQFRGIHLFVGTQILDYKILLSQYRKSLEIAQKVAHKWQQALHTVDFGGGLGIPYFTNDRDLEMDKFQQGLSELITEIKDEPLLASTQFLVEPGRFLVGEGGIYIAQINDLKVSRGKKFAITDGGLHHHLAASGNFGQVIKRNYPVALLNKLDDELTETIEVVGPLCTPLDVLARAITLPQAEVGDLVGVFQSGAYARSASPLEFLSHPQPSEVWIEAGKAVLINN